MTNTMQERDLLVWMKMGTLAHLGEPVPMLSISLFHLSPSFREESGGYQVTMSKFYGLMGEPESTVPSALNCM